MECKVVLVGDSKCGKSALLHRFAGRSFVAVYTPTDFERCSVEHAVGERKVQITVWDTSGATGYDSVRPLSYKDARAFVLCFDLGSQATLNNALKKWFPEIRTHSQAPIILCGCKSDIREDVCFPVSTEQGMEVSRQIRSACYVETSSKEDVGVTDVLELSSISALGQSRFSSLVRRHAPHLKRHLRSNQQPKSCVIM